MPYEPCRHFSNDYIVYNKNGVALMKVRNPRWQWAGGWRGAKGSVAGSGIIGGVFQLVPVFHSKKQQGIEQITGWAK